MTAARVAALDRRAATRLPRRALGLAVRIVPDGTAARAARAASARAASPRAASARAASARGAAAARWPGRPAIADGRPSRSTLAFHAAEQPAGPGDPGPGRAQRAPQVVVVGDHEQGGGAGRPAAHPLLIDQVDEQRIGAPPTGVPDGDPRRDLVAAQAAIGRSVEDDFDGDARRSDGAQPADERGRRRRRLLAGHQAEQVRTIDEQAGGAGEGVEREAGHGPIVRVARKPVRSDA
jgi:hypothetical protein